MGDVLHGLATLSRVLPDDAYPTNLALRERRAGMDLLLGTGYPA